MPLLRIQSIDDPRLVHYRGLKQSNLTRYSGRFITEGDKPTRRLLASGLEVDSVLVADKHLPRIEPLVPPDVPLLVVPESMVEGIVGFDFHRGVLGCGRRPAPLSLGRFLLQHPGRVTMVVCAEVQGPDNLGVILRTSSALRVDGVMLGPKAGDPFMRRVVRVSMGTALALPIVESRNLLDDLRRMREVWGIELAAAVLDESAEPLDAAGRSERFALLLGNEGHGLADDVLAECQRRITIAMPPGVDSLNVAIAAGIFIYHFTRGERKQDER
ncbi:MAG: RNA methyltransferase [Pirellulales bacterium]|nr:RNA methyltransferase [Pirellulales bacterium]